MSKIVIGINFSNVDTGELVLQKVDEYDFQNNPNSRKSFHALIDHFINTVVSIKSCDGLHHDTFSFELRSYRSHEELNLPF